MKKHVSIALIVVLVLCGTVAYQVDHGDAAETVNIGKTPNYYYFVGFSESWKKGDAGLRGLNKACADKFGQGARMCTSQEIMTSWKIPSGTTPAWVNPSNITLVALPDGGQIAIDTTSGVKRKTTQNQHHEVEAYLNCEGWGSESGECTGLAWAGGQGEGGEGRFEKRVCCEPLPVACCRR